MPHAALRYASAPPTPGHHRVTIIGGGLVGLTLALDLAQRGIQVLLLDDDDTVSTGSRAICMAQRSLEIFARLGLGRRMLEKGVTWNTGRVYFRDRELFSFDLLPDPGYEYPAFINLQQYYAEQWLVEACQATGRVDLRWKHSFVAMQSYPDGVTVEVNSPGGAYQVTTEWLLAADGARSPVRHALELPFTGRVFRDRFLIADVVMQAPYPTERRFWFDPPFHPDQSALLHKQPDNIWRIDLQLGWDADPDVESKPERVIPRIQAMLGPAAQFELEWVSLYTFRCRRLERFVHDRVVFVGDSAHQVSPFGARGGNGGVQDADNLAWKLVAILTGKAPHGLIRTYDQERIPAADENILHSTRATDFITPKTPAARAYRDAALRLAEHHPFARSLINSGRLSRPHTLPIAADSDTWSGAPPIGSPAPDAPIQHAGRKDWLLRHLGPDFTLLTFPRQGGTAWRTLALDDVTHVSIKPDEDVEGLVAQRYAPPDGACILVRPDHHIAALFRTADPARIRRAIARAYDAPVPSLEHAG